MTLSISNNQNYGDFKCPICNQYLDVFDLSDCDGFETDTDSCPACNTLLEFSCNTRIERDFNVIGSIHPKTDN